ncbi:hypothetical protein F9C11_20740 [Amycolatopsis sp. VS8301801F10]|uniref:hypothetical protein n=1 Tax=Amycolatopsis sp. VS8301801F10 TaxID=2652442 RepID=UPI0038FD1C9A
MVTNDVKGEWYAGRPFTIRGRLVRTGGKLILDENSVRFMPLYGLGLRRRYGLEDIVAVEPVQNVPPKLQLRLRDGSSAVFAVFVERSSPVWSDDASARDEAVAAISALVENR